MRCQTPFLDSRSIMRSSREMPGGEVIVFDLHPHATKIGFTGTRRGMTAEQKTALRNLLQAAGGEFHHGDCVGADAEAHDIAQACGLEPVIHPPTDPKQRAWKAASRILLPLPYLHRNKEIVRETESIIATPSEFDEQHRSGTWSTVRYARKLGRQVLVILPDGRLQ